jgi:hypothetical protein
MGVVIYGLISCLKRYPIHYLEKENIQPIIALVLRNKPERLYQDTSMRFVRKYLLASNSENYICNSNVSNIYVVIVITESIPLLVDYYSPRVSSAQLSVSALT